MVLLSAYVLNVIRSPGSTIPVVVDEQPSYSGLLISWDVEDIEEEPYADEYDEDGEFDPSLYQDDDIDELMWLLEQLIEDEEGELEVLQKSDEVPEDLPEPENN